jgi:hypothetical protein
MLTPEDGLPDLGETSMVLVKGENARQPVTDVLAAQIMEAFGR